MKSVLLIASMLALATTLRPARAQTAPPATYPNPTPAQAKAIRTQTAERRAEKYQGPKVVRSSEKLGRTMLQKSKPADGLRTRLLPVKIK